MYDIYAINAIYAIYAIFAIYAGLALVGRQIAWGELEINLAKNIR